MSTNNKNTNQTNPKKGKSANNKPNTNPGSNRKKSAGTSNDASFKDYILLDSPLEEDGKVTGFTFQRAAKVKLPNGDSHLFVTEEIISLNFGGAISAIPKVVKFLEKHNQLTKDFVTVDIPTRSHSVESKLLRYLDNSTLPEKVKSNLMKQLKSSKILLTSKKPDSKQEEKPKAK